MTWERARTAKQKEQRISEIIEATAVLYEEKNYEEITFASIAKQANFTRSNLYKYFTSKEEIFFEFLKHDVVLWRKETLKVFSLEKYSIKEFAHIWQEIQTKHERMLRLVSILYAHLEKKSSLETLIDFKIMVKHEFTVLCELLHRLFPNLTIENAAKFLQMQLAISIGLFTMTNLSENQQTVLAYPEFMHLKVDYNLYFEEAVAYLLQGLLEN